MSRRAASRLASLGFPTVYAYPGAKSDWMAFGLPIEGEHAADPTAGSVACRDVPTCALESTVGEAADQARASGWGCVMVVDDAGVVLGRVRGETLKGDRAQRVEAVMEDGPTTVRPSEPLPALAKRMHDRKVATIVVTNSDGVLIGVLRRDDADRVLREQRA